MPRFTIIARPALIWDALAESGPNSKLIIHSNVTRVVSDLAEHDAIFSCDVGTPIAWTARLPEDEWQETTGGSFNHGSMANAMLQALGAQAAFPQRQVHLALRRWRLHDDDGGVRHASADGLPLKIVVLNNGTLGFVELEMKGIRLSRHRCDLKNPNFAAMAEGHGIKGISRREAQELRAAVGAALQHKGPALLDVVSTRQELVMPPTTTVG